MRYDPELIDIHKVYSTELLVLSLHEASAAMHHGHRDLLINYADTKSSESKKKLEIQNRKIFRIA